MPNIESAKKRMRQNVIRRLRNRSRLSRMRTEIKRFRQLVAEGNVEDARQMLAGVYSVIDQTSKKRSIHTRTAARYKSRLAKLLEASQTAKS